MISSLIYFWSVEKYFKINFNKHVFFRIIVLDKGQIVEFDTPEALLADERSVFHSMAVSAGIAVAKPRRNF
jgi:hypothetical protein